MINQFYLQDANNTVYSVITTLNSNAVMNVVGHGCQLVAANVTECLQPVTHVANYCLSRNSTVRAAELLICGGKVIKDGTKECISNMINSFCPSSSNSIDTPDVLKYALAIVGTISVLGMFSYAAYHYTHRQNNITDNNSLLMTETPHRSL